MSRWMITTVAALAAGVLAGCGTAPTWSSAFAVDQDKVVAVENAASKAGVRVIWVNPPTRPAKVNGS